MVMNLPLAVPLLFGIAGSLSIAVPAVLSAGCSRKFPLHNSENRSQEAKQVARKALAAQPKALSR